MRKTWPWVALVGLAVLSGLVLGVRQWRSHSDPVSGRTTPASVPQSGPRTNPPAALVQRAPASVEMLRAALAAKESADSVLWPDEEIIRLVTALPDARGAFELLKSGAQNPATLVGQGRGGATPDLVRMRSLHALQYLAAGVPEVRPFLWGVFKADDVAARSDAFSTLQSIGFTTADLPQLVEGLGTPLRSPGLIRYVPQAIARLLVQNPPQAAAAQTSLERLLGSKDESIRFAAASALAGTRVDRDARVGRILREALRPGNPARALASAEALANAGPKAAALAPALMDLVGQTPEEYLRLEFLRAAAAIQPSLVQAKPELAAVLADDREGRELGQKLEADSVRVEDLLRALRFPQHATLAAFRLAELGPAARTAVPALIKALQGQDEESRDEIAEAINEIAPEVKIERVAAAVVAEALLTAERTLGSRANNPQDPATRLILEARTVWTWWTREEAVAFGVKLSALDAAAYNAYGSKLLEFHPELRPAPPAGK